MNMTELLNVLAAAFAAWVFGAIYYMLLARQWMAASGVPVGSDGKPANGNSPMPYVISFIALLIVAGMMRHLFTHMPVASIGVGATAGFGIGAFMIAPWILLNHTYGMKPSALTWIDGGYAALGCAVMGAVLAMF